MQKLQHTITFISQTDFDWTLSSYFSEVSSQAKRLKVDGVAADECSEDGPSPVIISEALAKFFGIGEREMHQPEALRRVWDYVKVKRLEVSVYLPIFALTWLLICLF